MSTALFAARNDAAGTKAHQLVAFSIVPFVENPKEGFPTKEHPIT
jgi:hypothetical protein